MGRYNGRDEIKATGEGMKKHIDHQIRKIDSFILATRNGKYICLNCKKEFSMFKYYPNYISGNRSSVRKHVISCLKKRKHVA